MHTIAPQDSLGISVYVQVLHDIFPVLVYANLAAAALLPLAVQALGVRACVRCAAAARVATRVLLIVGRSVASMQAAEVRPLVVPIACLHSREGVACHHF